MTDDERRENRGGRMKMRVQDGHLYAEVTLRDVVESTDVSDMPMLSEIKRLYAENAELRELCAEMWRDIPKTESCGWDMNTNTCTGIDECVGECSYWCRMRDLGIEVE